MRLDLSFLNPQALSSDSWILRIPLLRPLGSKAAWWNGLWVENFELVTNERPESCEQLLDRALPKWPGTWSRRGANGYVWRGGFTIYRLMSFGRGVRPLGTGTFKTDAGVTHIAFRVGAHRLGVYAGLIFSLFFAVLGVLMVTLALTGRVPIVWLAFGAPVIALPVLWLSFPARNVSTDGRRSEEAVELLAILEELIGARELPRA